MSAAYVHGYDDRESERLRDQAASIVDLLHGDTLYPAGAHVLEAGCGVGAQTVTLASRSPGARFTSIDRSAVSLAQARRAVEVAGLGNVAFREADLFDLPRTGERFDHVFVCFVLEHLADPAGALRALTAVLAPGGTLTVIEGDHGSTFFHPESADADAAVRALVEAQARMGGDAHIGRRLHSLLAAAGFADIRVSPRMVYVDGSRPDLADIFTRRTFTAMVEGARGPAIEAGIIDAARFDRGVAALNRTAEPDGVFCYTFFKAVAVKEPRS